MDSKRELIRRTLMIYLTCRDGSGAEAGKIVNISHRGMLMISERTLPLHETCDYLVDLPLLEGYPESPLTLSAECLWTGPAEAAGYRYFGFRFHPENTPSPEAIDILIRKIGFSDGQKKLSLNQAEFDFL